MFKRLITSTVVFLVLLGLGSLAILARPSGSTFLIVSPISAAPLADDSAPKSESLAAPAATQKFNAIAIPLDVSDNWASSGYSFTAKGLAQYVGPSSVVQVLHWNPTLQGFDKWYPAGNYGFIGGAYTTTAFALQVGGAYRLLLNSSNPGLNLLSLVGNVPLSDTIKFNLVGATTCKFNELSLPLERSNIANARDLATSMGGQRMSIRSCNGMRLSKGLTSGILLGITVSSVVSIPLLHSGHRSVIPTMYA